MKLLDQVRNQMRVRHYAYARTDWDRHSIIANHVERALRVIPMGKKNWMFAWTEVGAELIGVIQSLLVTCRIYEINPYDYLVDVLRRVDQHPASKANELTPRLWKQKFSENPMRSDLFDKNNK